MMTSKIPFLIKAHSHWSFTGNQVREPIADSSSNMVFPIAFANTTLSKVTTGKMSHSSENGAWTWGATDWFVQELARLQFMIVTTHPLSGSLYHMDRMKYRSKWQTGICAFRNFQTMTWSCLDATAAIRSNVLLPIEVASTTDALKFHPRIVQTGALQIGTTQRPTSGWTLSRVLRLVVIKTEHRTGTSTEPERIYEAFHLAAIACYPFISIY